MGEDGLVSNLDELKNNVKRSGGNLLHKIKMFRHKGRSHHHGGSNFYYNYFVGDIEYFDYFEKI